MTAIQNTLNNIKEDDRELLICGFNVIKDRCSTLFETITLIKYNIGKTNKEEIIALVDRVINIIDHYNTFILATNMRDGDARIYAAKLFFDLRSEILSTGKYLIKELSDYLGDENITKVEDALKSF